MRYRDVDAHTNKLSRVVSPPGQVADHLRCLDRPEMGPGGVENVKPSRTCAIDIALHVDLHPVRHAGTVPGNLSPDLAAAQRAVLPQPEGSDTHLRAVVDEQHLAVEGKAEAVWLLEIVCKELDLARSSDPVYPAKRLTRLSGTPKYSWRPNVGSVK